MYNKSPFANWVPKSVKLLLILLILFPVMTVAGAYTSVATDISGALAIYPEYISYAYYSGAVGMGMAILIMMRIKMRFRNKEIITTCAIVLAVLSYICGTTDNPWVLVSCSLLIGFFKMFPMIEVMVIVMFMVTPTGDRGKFYSVFYPISIGFGQFSGYIFSSLVYNGSWEKPYLLMSAMMLFIAFISLVFQHNQRFSFKMPLYQIDWLSIILLTTSYMFLNYSLIFMKQQAWFASPYVKNALIISVILFICLVYRQKFLKREMIDFRCFRKKNVIHGAILIVFMGIYLGSSGIYSQYTLGILGYTNYINADVNLWMIPGVVVAGLMAFLGFKNKWSIKYYIAFGFICLFINTLCLYLLIQPQMNIRYLEYAMIFKGTGMGCLYIGVWFYVVLGLPPQKMLGMMGALIPIRSSVSIALGGATIGWAAYLGQWQSLNNIAAYLDSGDVLHTGVTYQNLSQHALMASYKIVLGALCWMIVPILIFVATHSYGDFNFRRVILMRKMVRGNSIKGYKIS